MQIEWDGLCAPYRVLVRSNVAQGAWMNAGDVGSARSATIANAGLAAFLSIEGQIPNFAGANQCSQCHTQAHSHWLGTRHAGALETLKRIRQDNNSSCLVCHTVGYGLPSGFLNEISTPHLAGVQCENCHGPAGAHAANPDDLTKRPVIEISSKLCGGCHTDIHHPNYEEWAESLHAIVTPDVAVGLASTNISTSLGRMNSCGACHSGSVRLAALKNAENPLEKVKLPTGEDAAAMAIECVVCHSPHQKTAHGEQLRNPQASTNFINWSTSGTLTNGSFANQYQESVSVCGQCHNARGAQWTDTSRPPHHSPQYNILLGNLGVILTNDPPQASHREISTQCVHCHMHPREITKPTPENPVYKGHHFTVSYESCAQCHGDEGFAEFLAESTREFVTNRISTVVGLLNTWGTTKAPSALRTKYGALTWEYNNPGELSSVPGSTARGPTTAEQANVPDNIKQARFNLYLTRYDLSYGAHNASYVLYLLKVAETKVLEELAK